MIKQKGFFNGARCIRRTWALHLKCYGSWADVSCALRSGNIYSIKTQDIFGILSGWPFFFFFCFVFCFFCFFFCIFKRFVPHTRAVSLSLPLNFKFFTEYFVRSSPYVRTYRSLPSGRWEAGKQDVAGRRKGGFKCL